MKTTKLLLFLLWSLIIKIILSPVYLCIWTINILQTIIRIIKETLLSFKNIVEKETLKRKI